MFRDQVQKLDNIEEENLPKKNWVGRALKNEKRSVFVLSLLSFAESSFFPIPPDVLLIPLVYVRKEFLRYALITTFFSVLGGLFGYLIGYALFELLGEPLVSLYHLEDEVIRVMSYFNTYGFWAVFLAALTPIPYKAFTITAGLFHFALLPFLVASLIGRGLRFVVVAYCSEKFGPALVGKFKKHSILATGIFVFLVILYFLFIR